MDPHSVRCTHQTLPPYVCEVDNVTVDENQSTQPVWLLTENETNNKKVFGSENSTPFVKDAFHRFIIEGKNYVNLFVIVFGSKPLFKVPNKNCVTDESNAVNKSSKGTKAGAWLVFKDVAPLNTVVVRCRLYQEDEKPLNAFGEAFEDLFIRRRNEADEFYTTILTDKLKCEEKQIARQACAGLLWSKQFYHYIVRDWLGGDKSVGFIKIIFQMLSN